MIIVQTTQVNIWVMSLARGYKLCFLDSDMEIQMVQMALPLLHSIIQTFGLFVFKDLPEVADDRFELFSEVAMVGIMNLLW